MKADHDCLFGKIRSEWKRKDGNIDMLIEVPANTTATIVLPKGVLQVNDKPARASQEIKNFKLESNSQLFELGSGIYNLHLN